MLIIVHGGAGEAPVDPDPQQAVLDDAAAAGAVATAPIDAVEAAIRPLESDPLSTSASAVRSSRTAWSALTPA